MLPLPLPGVGRVRVSQPTVWDGEFCTDPGPRSVLHCALMVDGKALWKSWEEGERSRGREWEEVVVGGWSEIWGARGVGRFVSGSGVTVPIHWRGRGTFLVPTEPGKNQCRQE